MDSNQILSEVNAIFRDVLNNKKINLDRNTTAKDISEWDSLSNIHLVLDIEQHFKIRFTTPEIQGWKNVGEMVNNIEKKDKKINVHFPAPYRMPRTSIENAIADYLVLHPMGTISKVYDIEEQLVKVCFFSIGDIQIEFVAPYGPASFLYRMLEKNPGFYHIGVYTDDINKEIERLEKEGYRKINQFRSAAFNNHFCAFLLNNQRHMIELIENG